MARRHASPNSFSLNKKEPNSKVGGAKRKGGRFRADRSGLGGELLAEGDAFSVQAFRLDSGYALQFHPEVTHAMMYRWLVRGAHRMELPGAKQRHEHIADRAVHDHASRNWLTAFIDHWMRFDSIGQTDKKTAS